MNDVEEAGTRLPADASILWGNEMDAYENRIPIHYSKRHPFWVGQRGCGSGAEKHLSAVGVDASENRIPIHDIKRHAFWGGQGSSSSHPHREKVGFLRSSVLLS